MDPSGCDRGACLRHRVETDDLDPLHLAGFLHGRQRAQRRVVVDAEDRIEIGMRLQNVFRRTEGLVLDTPAGQFGDDLNAGVPGQLLLESPDSLNH